MQVLFTCIFSPGIFSPAQGMWAALDESVSGTVFLHQLCSQSPLYTVGLASFISNPLNVLPFKNQREAYFRSATPVTQDQLLMVMVLGLGLAGVVGEHQGAGAERKPRAPAGM